MPTPARPRWILPAIVLGQLAATSIWFAPNAVMPTLQAGWAGTGGEGPVTAAVQLGFIAGTLVFALAGVADRFHASRVFLLAAIGGALANALVIPVVDEFNAVLALRFVAGFCLAGVYPVGMRIAAGWYEGGLGRALGFLVGALMLGTASGHAVRALVGPGDWAAVIAASSIAAVIGGAVVAAVPEGTVSGGRAGGLRFGAVFSAFRSASFRASALGYFGHMWELYALWAFMPVWLAAQGFSGRGLSLTAFGVIAAGAVGCVAGGLLARRAGSGRVALVNLAVSGLCALASPLVFGMGPGVVTAFALVWGLTAAADSPQFSALNARNAPPALVGSALTLANAIGFGVTVVSLSLLEVLRDALPISLVLLALVPGPAFGVIAARRLFRRE